MGNELSARLRLGDPSALEEAMERYAPYAAKIISAYLNRTLPPEDMEEVLSDVFLRLWNSREQLRGEEVKPYLAAIARNAARQRLRQFHPSEPLPENWEDDTPLPEQQAERAEQAEALRQAIDAMPPPERALFLRLSGADRGGGGRRHRRKPLHPAGTSPPGPKKAAANPFGKGCFR